MDEIPRNDSGRQDGQSFRTIEKYTAGEPREEISRLLPLGTEDAYQQAKKISADRFGNPFLMADAYRKKINDRPKITPL